jgi:hypothetical protein
LALLISLFVPATALAQPVQLRVSDFSLTPLAGQDLIFQDTASFQYTVVNSGNDTVTLDSADQITVNVRVEDSLGNPSGSFQLPAFTIDVSTQAAPAGTLATDSGAVQLNANRGFKPGGNLVVVWPSANFQYEVDSNDTLERIYQVKKHQDRKEALRQQARPLKVYPNPLRAGQALYFTGLPPQRRPESVRVYNAQGRQVLRIDQPEQPRIPVQSLPQGQYILTVRARNGQRYAAPFIKAE